VKLPLFVVFKFSFFQIPADLADLLAGTQPDLSKLALSFRIGPECVSSCKPCFTLRTSGQLEFHRSLAWIRARAATNQDSPNWGIRHRLFD
jgi:hypothetical protein